LYGAQGTSPIDDENGKKDRFWMETSLEDKRSQDKRDVSCFFWQFLSQIQSKTSKRKALYLRFEDLRPASIRGREGRRTEPPRIRQISHDTPGHSQHHGFHRRFSVASPLHDLAENFGKNFA